MENDFLGAALAFAAGVVISFGNYKLSEYFLIRFRNRYSAVSLIRQFVNVAYVLLIFFLAAYTPWDRTYLLIGGVLGITLPTVLSTYKLIKKLNTADTQTKEDDNNG